MWKNWTSALSSILCDEVVYVLSWVYHQNCMHTKDKFSKVLYVVSLALEHFESETVYVLHIYNSPQWYT